MLDNARAKRVALPLFIFAGYRHEHLRQMLDSLDFQAQLVIVCFNTRDR